MKIKLHRFKPSGKWYDHFEDEFEDGLEYYYVMVEIEKRHKARKYGDPAYFDILVMGDEHPMGFPFIDRAIK